MLLCCYAETAENREHERVVDQLCCYVTMLDQQRAESIKGSELYYYVTMLNSREQRVS